MADDDPPRGLICHDDVAVQRAIGVILQRNGFSKLVVARTASEAIAAAERIKPDAVVVDLALTGELGLTAITAFRDAAPDCHIFCLSPFNGLGDKVGDAGAECLLDPCDLRPLEHWLVRSLYPDSTCGCAACRRQQR